MMQTTESSTLDKTQKGGATSAMQSASTLHERAGFVRHKDVTDIAGDQGVTVTETDFPGSRVVTEPIAAQVVGEFATLAPIAKTNPFRSLDRDAITIGEALDATANKAVDKRDAAATQAAEVRATANNVIKPDGVAAAAQHAPSMNAKLTLDESKTKLGEVLAVASSKMSADKAVTREDAKGVIGADLRNNLELATFPGGVADSMTAAARMDHEAKINL